MAYCMWHGKTVLYTHSRTITGRHACLIWLLLGYTCLICIVGFKPGPGDIAPSFAPAPQFCGHPRFFTKITQMSDFFCVSEF